MNLNVSETEYPWYVAGLHFQCIGCGSCCSGPDEGYIWVTAKEIEFLAEELGIAEKEFRKKYTKRIGNRISIIEDQKTKDCIFLTDVNGSRGCKLYNCRPNQCRTWPFWDMNLESPDGWNWAAMKCPGMNHGRLYTFEEIEKIRTQTKWW